MSAVRKLVDRVCPREEIVVSARRYPQLCDWAEAMGIRWEWDKWIDIEYPKEYGEP